MKQSPLENLTYSYDYQNRMTASVLINNAGVTNLAYKYDPFGIRVEKSVNGAITKYLVDHNLPYAQVLEERNAMGNLQASYVYGDDLISQNRLSGTSYYHYDGLGSTRTLTDPSANITDTYNYEAFGTLLNQTGSTPNDYLFTGEQYDPNLGFYYLRARYYDPEIGRFTTLDTWDGVKFDPQSLHKYLYCANDPVNKIDPSGNFLTEMLTNLALFSYTRLKDFGTSIAAYVSSMYSLARIFVLYGIRTIQNLFTYGQTYSSRLIEYAESLYPKLADKTQLHHIIPKYICSALRISEEIAVVELPAAVHQLLTNSIRISFPFGSALKNFSMIPSIIIELINAYGRALFPPNL